jgi:stage V sporulation protein AF
MLYMAFVAIANYTHPSYELGYAVKFFRIITLILTALLNVWGYIAGIVLFIAAIATNKMISGQSYLYPLIPFSFKKLGNALIRKRLPNSKE